MLLLYKLYVTSNVIYFSYYSEMCKLFRRQSKVINFYAFRCFKNLLFISLLLLISKKEILD